MRERIMGGRALMLLGIQNRVLVVDEDAEALARLTATLDAPNIRVDGARSLEQAMAAVREQSYAVIIAVHLPPALDGLKLLVEAGERQPDALRVLLAPESLDGELADRGLGRIFRFDPRIEPRNLVPVVAEGMKLHRLEREQRELIQRLGVEYQKLQKREKLLDAVVKERTEEIQAAYLKLKAANRQALLGLAEAIEAKDAYTKGHCGRVAAYALALAKEARYPAEDMEQLEFSAFLHDIGKIGVRDAVLLKPGPLDDEEWKHMRIHPVVGYTIASQIEMLQPTMACIRNHHERWDGKGYPDGLAGEQIPLVARIVSISDAFDAMATDRPYKKALSIEECRAIFKKQAGVQFDPQLVQLWLEREIAEHFIY
ncbi:MAG TPA: HD domain-containing phosphohydrolase [Polyangia bacterium]|nr:HD domain-containing phosphohydrolase [Polyangia bacterium]